jgi:hypothetical protein
MSEGDNSIKPSRDYSFIVRNIHIKEQFINIPDGFNLSTNPILSFMLDVGVGGIIASSQLQILITYEFRHEEHLLLKLVVENDYQVKNIQSFFDENGAAIKSDLTDHLVEISIHHTRGVQSTIIKNTALEKLYIPITDKQLSIS